MHVDAVPARRSPAANDSLQKFLRARAAPAARGTLGGLVVVAFTDPNDLLSYRLMNSRHADDPDVGLADVLVSNDKTGFKLLENPSTAHTAYGTNPDVARLIACGHPASPRCR